MGVAALVLGIIGLVLSFVPCIWWIGTILAVVGVILGIIGLVQSRTTHKGKWTALPGLVFSVTAVVWGPVLMFVFLGGLVSLGGVTAKLGLDDLPIIGPDKPDIVIKPLPPPPVTDPKVEQAERRVREARDRVGKSSLSFIWGKVREAHQAIDRVENTSERQRLEREADRIVIEALDREAQRLYDEARSAFERKEYERALELSKEVAELEQRSNPPGLRQLSGWESKYVQDAARLADDVRRAMDPNMARALSQLEDLEQRAPLAPVNAIWEGIGQVRQTINLITYESMRPELNQRTDEIIVNTLDREAERLHEEAIQHRDDGDPRRALEVCDDIINLERRTFAPRLRELPGWQSEWATKAAEMQQGLGVLVDPSRRYTVKGCMTTPRGGLAIVEDSLTGQTFKLQEGDRLDEYRVEEVDVDQAAVHLKSLTETVTLHKH